MRVINPLRWLYDKLPLQVRSGLRARMPERWLRWYAHRNTDVYLISYPKCGRTWLRLMLGRAIAMHFSLPQDEDTLFLRTNKRVHPKVPRISVIHEDRPMLKSPGELETSKTRYRHKKVILLVRDPRDVIVSSFFEMNKRSQLFGKNPYEASQSSFEGGLNDFIDRSQGGFDTILAYYNIWANNRDIPKDFLLVRYEDLYANPQAELRRVLDFLGLGFISDTTVAEAVAFASFENMRKMEVEGLFQTGILKPANKTDQESYKTRRGKIGGYRDYLSQEKINQLDQKIVEELSEIFGYRP